MKLRKIKKGPYQRIVYNSGFIIDSDGNTTAFPPKPFLPYYSAALRAFRKHGHRLTRSMRRA